MSTTINTKQLFQKNHPPFLFYLDSAALYKLNEQQFYLFGQIQTSQTGGQLFFPYRECSMARDRSIHIERA